MLYQNETNLHIFLGNILFQGYKFQHKHNSLNFISINAEDASQLTLLLLNTTCPVLANRVDPDQLASEEANWSGSALFVIKYVNFYQTTGLSNLIGWKLEVGVAS